MEALAYCEQLLRDLDRNRWLACLFAPKEHRSGLIAIYAFNCEIARIRDQVSEPLPGEVRLQWWRDLLQGEARGDASANPVAAALNDTIVRYRLPRSAFVSLIDAHGHDLYDDPLPTMWDLEGYCGETSSALLRLASFILADGGEAGAADISGHGGVACGIADLIGNIARHAAQGRTLIPEALLKRHGNAFDDVMNGRYSADLRAVVGDLSGLAFDHLAKAMTHLPSAPIMVRPAFMPLALVQPTLNRVAGARFDPFRSSAQPPQWVRQWHLWRFFKRAQALA